jgi:hypothetical protein
MVVKQDFGKRLPVVEVEVDITAAVAAVTMVAARVQTVVVVVVQAHPLFLLVELVWLQTTQIMDMLPSTFKQVELT